MEKIRTQIIMMIMIYHENHDNLRSKVAKFAGKSLLNCLILFNYCPITLPTR
jgi:hypothetical protein